MKNKECSSDLLSYPIETINLKQLTSYKKKDVLYNLCALQDDPIVVVQYALSFWNLYLALDNEIYHEIFLELANWLIEHAVRIGHSTCGWPITPSHPDSCKQGRYLSALMQGNALSVFIRAYQLTQEHRFLEIADRVVRTFEQDILDGGVSVPLGEDGVFFEEIAVYPSAHSLKGFIFALLGLYDYVKITNNNATLQIIRRSLAALHNLLPEFDTGFWTRSELLHRSLASPAELTLQSELLMVLAKCSGCKHCLTLALKWKHYQRRLDFRLRYLISSHCAEYSHAFWNGLRVRLFPKSLSQDYLRVCVPVTAFPVAGGMRTVLSKIAQVTHDIWQLEYITQLIGPHPEGLVIYKFGSAKMTPFQFPNVLLYTLAGFKQLISLLHHGMSYHIILPQDGIFTAAFAASGARIAGIRSVCIDHGNLGLLNSRLYRAERVNALAARSWFYRFQAKMRYLCYWPSLYLFALLSAHFVDHFLIPGVAGDGVEEICKKLGIGLSRITRFANAIDLDHHIILHEELRATAREKNNIPADAIVIVMICRLAPEKGLDIAVAAIHQALAATPPELRARVRVIFAGDGPLRKQLEADIHKYQLNQSCMLWGEVSAEKVPLLLGLSDIFLFTSRRAAGYPLAILEAMASGCAVIASAEPLANSRMLAEGRGIVVPVGDVEQTSNALVRLIATPSLCQHMGISARNYVAIRHNATTLRRTLMRVTRWAALDELLDSGEESVNNSIGGQSDDAII